MPIIRERHRAEVLEQRLARFGEFRNKTGSTIIRGNMPPMKSSKRQTPEEQELALKQAELLTLQTELAQRELDIATLQAEPRSFEGHYLRIVGVKYAELDDLNIRNLKSTAQIHPQQARQKEIVACASKRKGHVISEGKDY